MTTRRRFLFTIAALCFGPLLSSSAWAQINYAALKTELQTDPTGIGYAASVAAGNDTETARLINEVRTVPPTFTINRGPVPSSIVVNEIEAADLSALITNQLLQLQIITQFGTVDLGDASTRQILGGIFPVASATRTNLTALANRPASRAEVYPGSPGRNANITPDDVAKALRG